MALDSDAAPLDDVRILLFRDFSQLAPPDALAPKVLPSLATGAPPPPEPTAATPTPAAASARRESAGRRQEAGAQAVTLAFSGPRRRVARRWILGPVVLCAAATVRLRASLSGSWVTRFPNRYSRWWRPSSGRR